MGWIKSSDKKRMEWFPDENLQLFFHEHGYKWERNGNMTRYWVEVTNPVEGVHEMGNDYENWDVLSLMSELRTCPDKDVHRIQELIPEAVIYDAIKRSGFTYLDMKGVHYAVIQTKEKRRW